MRVALMGDPLFLFFFLLYWQKKMLFVLLVWKKVVPLQ